ncbi:DNA polymerase III subunit gamma and tau [Gandjariella thermophila]|uniref:DNA polymerase III subunit gamma/tau n=1 Tax=Gandjariella thermophila TaxID=1931992 RepID=A0A4D4J831_9PSEU|nr:DNA polymerase III subunit gamma and tau [Gandjariella thermophila]GDY30676.1 DNA polymerase III subunit gamma and tau [Gandjariella thermophila]
MALALYRKYRPASFAEVVGQEHVTEPLRTALAAGRVNHAYLFSGPRGCGKTSSARILARSLNCVQGPTPDPCGECDSCIALAPEGSGSVDVVELDAASHGGVDDARELRDRAFYAPAQSRYRVFIIDEAHMVTTQGFNALLKIVEEPPEHLVFIFATTEPDKVLPTIRSRTHHYPFRLIPPGPMRALLEKNCANEGVTVEPTVYPLVIRAGGGSARDTQSIMDQLLAGAGPEGVTYERAVALLGVTDVALIDDMVDGLAAGDGAAVFGTVDRLVEAGHDPRRFAADLLDRFRDLVLLRSVPDAAQRGLVASPQSELDRMAAQAERIGAATLSRYAEILHTGLTEMRGATAPRLLLELLCARMLLPAASDSEAALLQRLERLERRVTLSGGEPGGAGGAAPPAGFARPGAAGGAAAAGPAAAPEAAGSAAGSAAPARDRPTYRRPSQRAAADAEQPAPPADAEQGPSAAARGAPAESAAPPAPGRESAPARPAGEAAGPEPWPAEAGAAQGAAGVSGPPAEGAQAPGGIDATRLRQVWPELLREVGQRSKPAYTLLSNATVQAVEGNTLVLAMPTAGLARQLGQESRTEVIRAALQALLLGEDWVIRCVHADTTGPGAATAPTAAVRPRPVPARSSQQRSAEPPQRREPPPRPAAPVDDVPPPPEPPEPDEPPPPDEDPGAPPGPSAQAGAEPEGTPAVPPREAAIRLLTTQLGARPVDGG